MSEFLLVDSPVLGALANVDRLDLVQSLLVGRTMWTATVAYEVSRVVSAVELPLLTGSIGEPIDIDDPSEIREVNRLRRVAFGGRANQPLEFLGCAEVCFLLTERAEFGGFRWLTDNLEILRYAERRGIATRQTRDLMAEAVLNGDIAADQARDVLLRIRCLN